MPPSTRRGARIAHVGIAVRAIDELLPFYRELLDLDDHPLADSDGARIAALAKAIGQFVLGSVKCRPPINRARDDRFRQVPHDTAQLSAKPTMLAAGASVGVTSPSSVSSTHLP